MHTIVPHNVDISEKLKKWFYNIKKYLNEDNGNHLRMLILLYREILE